MKSSSRRRRARWRWVALAAALLGCVGGVHGRPPCATLEVHNSAFDDVRVYHATRNARLGTVASMRPRMLRVCGLDNEPARFRVEAIGGRWTRWTAPGLPNVVAGAHYVLDVGNTQVRLSMR